MKRLFVIGIVAWLFLSGCSININGFQMDSKHDFNTYDEFLTVIEDLDQDYFTIEEQLEVDIDDVNSLALGSIFEDVELKYEDRETVKIQYFGVFFDKTDKDEFKLEVKDKGAVEFYAKWGKMRGPGKAMMVAYLPESFKEDLTLNTVSGDIRSNRIYAEDILVDVVSGDFDIKVIEGGSLTVNSVSGDVTVDKFVGEDVTIDTVSGDIEFISEDVEKFTLETVSGDIDLGVDEQKGDFRIDSTSGSVDINIKEINADLDLRSTSGDVKVVQSLSDVSSKGDHKLKATAGNGKYNININTVSGNIDIR